MTEHNDETVDLTEAAETVAELREKIAKAEARFTSRMKKDREALAEAEATLAKHAPVGSSVQGSKQVRITPGKKIDKQKLAENFPQDEFPQFWTSSIAASEVKKEIGENEYSRYQLPSGKSTITITDTI